VKATGWGGEAVAGIGRIGDEPRGTIHDYDYEHEDDCEHEDEDEE